MKEGPPESSLAGRSPATNPSPAAGEILCPHCGQVHSSGWSHCPNTGKALTVGPALIGRTIARRYKIHGLLGEGGMGAVYEAEHLSIGRRVALKRLHPELAVDAHAVHRFQREARAAGSTGHENIVDVLDLGFAEDGAPYLVMELLEGESLAQRLRRQTKLSPERAASIAGQVLAALEAVHGRGVIHRDLKPDNVFLTRRGGRRDFVKVLDFGVSKVATAPEATKLTRTGMMVGTPHYMSPEQARGMRDLDHRVDLYAVGVILYECLSGQLPFRGSNYHALLQAILAGDAPPLQVLVPGIPQALAAIVHRALAGDRELRFPDARTMWAALVPFGALPPPRLEAPASEVPPALSELPTAAVDQDSLAPQIAASRRTLPTAPPLDPEEGPVLREATPVYVPLPLADHARAFAIASPDWRQDLVPPLSTSRTPSMVPVASSPARATNEPVTSPRPAGSAVEGADGAGDIKGAFVLAARRDLGVRHGGRADEPFAALGAEDRAALSGVILPVTWVPAGPVLAWLDEVERIFGRGDGAELHRLGRGVGAQLLPTRHRLLVSNTTVTEAVSRIPTLWTSYVEGGRVEAYPDRVEVVSGPSTMSLLATMAGFVEYLLELTGGRGATCRPHRPASPDEPPGVTLRYG